MKLKSTGRGRYYSRARGMVESTLGLAFMGRWPARVWGRFPKASHVGLVKCNMALGRMGRPRLRIAFMSDLHVGPTTPWRTLERAVSLVNELSPDVLLLGGDYVFLDATPEKCRRLEQLIAGVDVGRKFGVWGNHDLWTDHDSLEAALASAGVRMLRNELVGLDGGHDDIEIFGLDEPWTGSPDGTGLIGSVKHCVALAHSPDAFDYVQQAAPALLVCGHTHGGQIALPGGRPLVVPGRRGKEWPHGEHRVHETRIVVSRGLGGIEIPVRAWSPPDVVCIDMV